MYQITPYFIYAELSKQQAEDMGAVYNAKRQMYRLPNTIGVLRELYKIYPNKDLALYGQQRVEQRRKMLELKTREDAPGDKRLRPYQRVDVEYLKRIQHAGIFNEMRTGKSPTSLKIVEDRERILIVCPAGIVLNWKEEVEKWLNKQALAVIFSKPKRLSCYKNWLTNNGILIISYETLRNDLTNFTELLKQYKTTIDALIVDEAHRLRSLKQWSKASKQSKAVFEIGKYADKRLALTGTPTVKSGDEIYGILKFLYPERFPGYWQFLDRYFETKDGFFGGKEIKGYKRKEELEEILTLISVNRKRKEVMKWLPPKQYQTIKLKLEGKQKKIYEEMAETFEYVEDGELKLDAPSVLAQLTRLRQITTAPKMLDLEAPSIKEKFILEWLDDNPNESVIIMSNFTSYLKILHGKIKGSVMITGDIPNPKRKVFEQQFQSGKAKVMLANIQAVQEGLTLDKGETIIFLDKAYNPANNEQAADRIVPVSEERNHNMSIISLVCQDTIDELIEYTLKHKLDITKVINNAGVNGLKRLLKEVNM